MSYSFLIVGSAFVDKPDQEEFLRGGLFGRRIPKSVPYEQLEARKWIREGKFVVGYDSMVMDSAELREILPDLEVIGNIGFEEEAIKIRSIMPASDTKEILSNIDFLTERLGKIDQSSYIEQEVLSTENIVGVGKGKAKKEVVERWILSKLNAHPKAIAFMQEDFFWDPSDDFAPFGSDGGSDGLYGFQRWRSANQEKEPLAYVKILEYQWGAPFDHLDQEAIDEIQSFKDGTNYFVRKDQEIIGVCLGQLVLEGTISRKLLAVGMLAVKRLMDERVLGLAFHNKEEWKEKLGKQLLVMEEVRELASNSSYDSQS